MKRASGASPRVSGRICSELRAGSRNREILGSCHSVAASFDLFSFTPSTVLNGVTAAPLHFEYLHIRLTQQGSNLQGTACYTSDVHLVFSGVSVVIHYPRVSVSAPNGFMFAGEFQANGTISGTRAMGSSAYPMTLTRDTFGSYAASSTTP